MRSVFGMIFILHSTVHAFAFASAFGLDQRLLPRSLRARVAPFDDGGQGTLLLGVWWAALAIALWIAAYATWCARPWWPAYAAGVLLASLYLSLIEWRVCAAARLGTLVNAVLLGMLWSSHLLDVIL